MRTARLRGGATQLKEDCHVAIWQRIAAVTGQELTHAVRVTVRATGVTGPHFHLSQVKGSVIVQIKIIIIKMKIVQK